jgi:hypothetical protein
MAESTTESFEGSAPADLPARATRVAALAALLLHACGSGGSGAPRPVPRSIAPDTGYAGLTTAVQIHGDDFAARPTSNGQADTHHRAWLGDTELADVTWIDSHTFSATVPAGLAAGVAPLRVQNAYGMQGTLPDAFTTLVVPASLTASIATSRGTAGLGQPFDVTFTVKNGGTGAANLGPVDASQTGAAADCGPPSPAGALTLAAGASQAYTWSCAGTGAGTLELDATVSGNDAATNAPLQAAPPAAAQVQIQTPAALAAALAVSGGGSSVEVGQAFTLQAAIANHGGATATLGSLTVTPAEAGCGAPTPALPIVVQGGLEVSFSLTCAAATAGPLAPAVSVRGHDANTGGLVTASATLVPTLTAQPPSVLTATVAAAPTTFAVGQGTGVTLYVTNGPGLPTAQITSVAPWATGQTGVAACTPVTVSPGTAVAASGTVEFSWTCTASQAGDVLLGASVNYIAGGVHGSASPVVPVAATITP